MGSRKPLEELVRTVPSSATRQVITSTHAGKTRLATVIKVGWLHLRLLPDSEQEPWAVVAEEYEAADEAVRTLALLTDVPVVEVATAQVP